MMRKMGFVLRSGARCLVAVPCLLAGFGLTACSSDDSGANTDPVSEPDGGDGTEEGTDTDTAETDGTDTAGTDTDTTDVDMPDGGAEPPDGGAETDDGAEGFSGEGGVDIEVEAGGPTFSVTGSIKIGSTLFADTDTPNIDNPIVRNDEFSTDSAEDESQAISSPSTVGGYIGPLPVLDDQGDPTEETTPDDRDVYRVTLAQGQVVTLFTAEPPDENTPLADLDLFLLETANGTIVSDSQGAGDKEQVVAPSTGDFWVAVDRYVDDNEPEDGQAIYSLAVGIAQPSATQQDINMQRLTTDWEAVPGEAVAYMNVGPQSAELAQAIAPRNAPDATGFQLLDLNGVAKDVAAQGRAGLLDTILQIKALRKMGGFRSISPNYIYQAFGSPAGASDDPLLASQWHYDQIDLAEAWAASDLTANGQRGAGVVVAVLDTGIALSHPDWVNGDGSSQLTDTGFDFISDPDVAADGDGPDSDPDDPGDARTPGDSSFHGTHCAGTIAAATDNGEGAAGVAPNARIMPIRVLGRGGGTLEDIRQGVLYAAGLQNSSGQLPSEPADVISMSLGGPGASDAMAAAVAAANAEGVIVVAAAGNSNAPAELFSPAGVEGVITVSATDFNREKAFYSNFGTSNGTVDVAAPGGDTGADANLDGQPDGVVSLVFKNSGNTQYAAYQGTSMACPHVSGVAALMKSIWPAMGANEFRAALPEITVDLGDAGEDPIFGHGLINANLAVAYAIEQSGEEVNLDPVLSVSTTILDFGGSVNNMLLAVGNTGQGELSINSVTASEDWIGLPGGGLDEGTNQITVDRGDLPEGVSTGTITIESNGGTKLVSVRVFVGEQPTGGDVGIVYVLLVDPQTGEQMAQAATGLDENYEFSITDVPGGRYYLVAGTDLRDTFFLGNDGDVYGAFPLAQDPQLICRFVDESDAPEGTPDCPALTEAQLEDPDLEGVIIPAQYLVDLGAREEEADDVGGADAGVVASGFSPQASLTTRPMRVRRAPRQR